MLAHRRSAAAAAVLGVLVPVLVLGAGVLAAAAGAGASPSQSRVTLPQAVPAPPAGTTELGAAPPGQAVAVDVVLAGRDPSGLAQAVGAVSTPGSPAYRHYLTASQFAGQFGPSPSEVAQVSSVLRSEGLTVGRPGPGSSLLPVSGTAAAVAAAFGTALESEQAPGEPRALVHTTPLQVPASVGGAVTGVLGLDGALHEHAMLVQGHAVRPGAAAPGPGATPAGPAGAGAVSHVAGTPQACAAAQQQAFFGSYTSTQLSSVFGLDQLFAQGRTGVGQTIAIVEFEQYLQSDFTTFQSCYGLTNTIRNVVVGGTPAGPPAGEGEAALDTELAAFNAPSASLVVYETPNNAPDPVAPFDRIASDDLARVVTTSWGNCESALGSAVLAAENQVFERMALQGQTVIAAAGDAGSEDCYAPVENDLSTSLAVDDPGAQPDVVSAGGTSLPSASAGSQSVWNDCQGIPQCYKIPTNGAGGGGYSQQWAANPGQPQVAGPGDQCGLGTCRSVPDIAYPANPNAGSVVAYSSFQGGWTAFGGTSVAAPTNAGLFADTDQGCYASLGRVGPALYAAASSSTFTDIPAGGDNDFTDTNGGLFGTVTGSGVAGYDPATGLGTPVDQNLSTALQGGDGCPSVSTVVPDTGPIAGAGAITIVGGGFADATSVNFGSVGTGQIVSQGADTITVIPPNAPGPLCVDVTVTNPQGISATSPADHYGFGGDLNCGLGYRFVASDGGVFDFGDAGFWGSAGGLALNSPVVGMAVTPSTNGYWLVAADGGVFTYGDARFFGSMGGQRLNEPIVGMAATADGGGYWLVAADGGIFSFGDAPFHGSTGGTRLNKPIVGMAATPDGGGYWLVASDGGIFSYGDAPFHGSTGSLHLNSPVVGMAAAPGGDGYWMVAADGGIFDYGRAGFFGSRGGQPLNKPVVGMAATPDGNGYWLVASDGGVFTYGDAAFYGSTGGITLNKPIVGMSSA